jgi:hypothetical protein
MGLLGGDWVTGEVIHSEISALMGCCGRGLVPWRYHSELSPGHLLCLVMQCPPPRNDAVQFPRQRPSKSQCHSLKRLLSTQDYKKYMSFLCKLSSLRNSAIATENGLRYLSTPYCNGLKFQSPVALTTNMVKCQSDF